MTTDSTSPARKRRRTRTRIRRKAPSLKRQLLLVALIALLLLIGYKVARTGVFGWQAYRSGMELLDLATQDPDIEDLPAVQASLGKLAAATSGLEDEIRPVAPLIHRLAFLPAIGGTLAATPELLTAGSELMGLGNDVLDVLGPQLRKQDGPATMDTLLAAVTIAGPDLAAMTDQADQAAKALAAIPADRLHPRLADKISEAQAMAPALASGLMTAPVLPTLLGFGRPTTYLLLVQNNQELRASGGFITAAGTLTLDRGKPGNLSIADSYQVYSKQSEYSWAPEPMQRYMEIDLLLFRDANWSPDFPRTAQLTSAIYSQDTGQPVDGVVSVDLRATEILFEALGPLAVPGTDELVTADNIVEQVKLFFEQPLESEASLAEGTDGNWWRQRKDFMPALAGAALQHVSAGNVDYSSLIEKSLQALNEGAIQVWVDDEDMASQLAASNWDGGVRPLDGADFLFHVDTNMGYNKVDAIMERSLAYHVSWPNGAGGPGVATTSMTYNHPVEVSGHVCNPASRYGDSYDAMTERCYFDFVRLYAPGGSTLIDVQGVEPGSIDSQRGESGTTIFSGFFVMEPGSEHTVEFTYELPPDIRPDDYQLVVQRQSGTAELPLTITVAGEELATTLAQRRLEWSVADQ